MLMKFQNVSFYECSNTFVSYSSFLAGGREKDEGEVGARVTGNPALSTY